MSKTKGSALEFRFTGTGVKWLGTKAPNRGRAEIHIDGKLLTEVDCYGADVLHQQVHHAITGLAAGPHVLRIVVAGEKNPEAKDCYVDVNVFHILP